MDETFDSVVDSGSSFEPSITEPDPPSVPEPAPDPLPVDPAPEPTPDPEPVEPLPSDPVEPSPSDPAEDVVSPGEDPSVGDGEDLSGEDQQQPGEEVPGDQIGNLTGNSPSMAVDPQLPVSNIPQIFYSLPQQQLNAPAELILDNVETFQLSPIEDSTGLKGVLLRIIGPYDNIVTQYRYQQSNNSYYTYVNEVTPDYPWIASAALFIVLLVSLFGLLKRSMSWMK